MTSSPSDRTPRTEQPPSRAADFFQGVMQFDMPWRDRIACTPVFYYDLELIQVQFLAPLKAVTALLPSHKLHPVRVMPWQAVVTITAYEHRDTDIGPYNELAIGIPVSLAGPVWLFTGLIWPQPAEPDFFLLHLPVTTEIACELGIQTGAYPKFLADIRFTEERDWRTCRMDERGQHILTLGVRKGQLKPVPRIRIHPLNIRDGRLLRPLFIVDEHEESISTRPSDVRLELGDHPVARQLKQLPLGRPASINYSPKARGILAYVTESIAA